MRHKNFDMKMSRSFWQTKHRMMTGSFDWNHWKTVDDQERVCRNWLQHALAHEDWEWIEFLLSRMDLPTSLSFKERLVLYKLIGTVDE